MLLGVLLDGVVALGVWLFWLFGSLLVLDVWPIASPADSSKAAPVYRNLFIATPLDLPARFFLTPDISVLRFGPRVYT